MKDSPILGGFSIANIAFLVLIFALGTWVAEDYPFSTFIAYAPPAPWLAPCLILLLCSLTKRNRRWLKVNGTAFVVFGWVLLGIKVPILADRSGSDGSFTLMTFNMMGGSGGFDRILQIIEENDPDIICFQEASVLGVSGYANSQIDGYYISNHGGVAVATKEKPITSNPVPLFPGSPGALEVELASGLKIVAVHLSFHKLDSVSKKGVPVHLQQISRKHEIEVDILTGKYGGRPKVVIAGDFNCPPRGHIYSRMRRHFTDAFATAGWLTGFTWPSEFPVQRIDYAFTTDLKVQSARTISSTVSNHLPVLFRFKP
ncbi:MAG: endonuclease/exonuclease/phosphatase family protein [Chlorobia bacterium]|nr:endonuclease/exonuclease/phosphatase family protein [Fimbriimonadaceae bacterium]